MNHIERKFAWRLWNAAAASIGLVQEARLVRDVAKRYLALAAPDVAGNHADWFREPDGVLTPEDYPALGSIPHNDKDLARAARGTRGVGTRHKLDGLVRYLLTAEPYTSTRPWARPVIDAYDHTGASKRLYPDGRRAPLPRLTVRCLAYMLEAVIEHGTEPDVAQHLTPAGRAWLQERHGRQTLRSRALILVADVMEVVKGKAPSRPELATLASGNEPPHIVNALQAKALHLASNPDDQSCAATTTTTTTTLA